MPLHIAVLAASLLCTCSSQATAPWSAPRSEEHQHLTVTALQREAAKAAQKIAELTTARAELAAAMEQEAELLASPDLLHNHPELNWERAAKEEEAIPRLGAAQRLFIQDRRLTDFRSALHLLCQSAR